MAEEVQLPFEGRWFVFAGGDTINVNHHMAVPSQWYAVDFTKVGGEDQRTLTKTDGHKIEDFYSWGEEVISPVAGEIVSVVDGLPDNPMGKRDEQNAGGNEVVIKAATNRFVFIEHLQKSSVAVKPGELVRAGQLLGRCGNSGNSDFPHIHMHVQDTLNENEALGLNMIFMNINVELTGKIFENVDWPLICGLFVWKK